MYIGEVIQLCLQVWIPALNIKHKIRLSWYAHYFKHFHPVAYVHWSQPLNHCFVYFNHWIHFLESFSVAHADNRFEENSDYAKFCNATPGVSEGTLSRIKAISQGYNSPLTLWTLCLPLQFLSFFLDINSPVDQVQSLNATHITA